MPDSHLEIRGEAEGNLIHLNQAINNFLEEAAQEFDDDEQIRASFVVKIARKESEK